MNPDNKERLLNEVSIQTISDQVIAIAGKIEHLDKGHRLLINHASGVLHQVLLELALVPMPVSADEVAETPVQADVEQARYEVDRMKLRASLGREPTDHDMDIAQRIGYPPFVVSQPVWVSRDGDRFRCTVTQVTCGKSTGWYYKVSQYSGFFYEAELEVVTQ